MEDEGGAGLAHAYVVPLTGQRISASLDRRFAYEDRRELCGAVPPPSCPLTT
jgi:hypothetical protein